VAAAVTPDRARVVARAAAARLAAMIGPDGRFVYRYALNDPTFTSRIYSDGRHVVAVWGLAAVADDMHDVAGFEAALERAARAMAEHLFRAYGGSGALCVLDEGLIKLGGSALGVAAEALLQRRSPDAGRSDRIVRLARYVVSQRESDGDFLPMRVPGPMPRPHPLRDDLTPGQAVLALAVATQATGDESYVGLATDSVDRFAARDYLVGRLAHWMLYAIEALARVASDDAHLAYAGRLAAGIEAMSLPDESIPIACASEGLLAYARTLRARGGREGEVASIMERVEANLRRQLRFFHPSGAFVMSTAKHEVRIDTIMHNLLAFHGWAALSSTAGPIRRDDGPAA
jgi:hypothetical protein